MSYIMTLAMFKSLTISDFENSAVLAEIRVALEDREQLKAELASANHDYDELMKERADYVDKNKRLRHEIQAARQWQTCPACSRIFATQS